MDATWDRLRAWVIERERMTYHVALARLALVKRGETVSSYDLGECSARPRRDGVSRGVSVAPVLEMAERLGVVRRVGYVTGPGRARRRQYRRVR